MDWLLNRFKEVGVRVMFMFEKSVYLLHGQILTIENELFHSCQSMMTIPITTSRKKCHLMVVNKQKSCSSVGIQDSYQRQRICFDLYGTPSWNDDGSTAGYNDDKNCE